MLHLGREDLRWGPGASAAGATNGRLVYDLIAGQQAQTYVIWF